VLEIKRYKVEAEIGRGAMGVVYLALDPRLQRRVAIKVYRTPDGLSADQKREYQERFQREAQAAACLSHPGIVTVYDCAEDEETGDPYIAMEYVQGRTLRERLDADGCPPPDRAFEIVAVLAQALHSAHETGIVHRDMKPGNILVRDTDEQVKIADFGVARLATSELTRTGMTLGSPAYMSPEHITRGVVDARSDLFALAVILYEVLCGERPFQGEELAGLAYSIVHENPIPITKRVAGLPRAMDEFFDRALAKDPADRFADGAEFAAALRAARAAPLDSGFVATLAEVNLPETGAAAREARENLPPTDPPLTPSQQISLPTEDDDGAPQPGTYPSEAIDHGWDEPARAGSARRWFAVAVVTLMLLAGARWVWSGGTSVELHGKSSVRAGTLILKVDGRKVLSRELAADGSKGRRLLKRAVGLKEEKFTKSIGVTPGTHEIVALLEDDDETQHEKRLIVDVERGQSRKVVLRAGTGYGAPLTLKAD
jgi:serine/threonine protein kinase